MNYEQDILRILFEAGKDGLPLRKIVRHVYNQHNGLFDALTYEVVYRDVFACVKKNSKSKYSLLENTERRGFYRMNMNSAGSRQLLLAFSDDGDDNQAESKSMDDDMSLSLF